MDGLCGPDAGTFLCYAEGLSGAGLEHSHPPADSVRRFRRTAGSDSGSAERHGARLPAATGRYAAAAADAEPPRIAWRPEFHFLVLSRYRRGQRPVAFLNRTFARTATGVLRTGTIPSWRELRPCAPIWALTSRQARRCSCPIPFPPPPASRRAGPSERRRNRSA